MSIIHRNYFKMKDYVKLIDQTYKALLEIRPEPNIMYSRELKVQKFYNKNSSSCSDKYM